MVSSVAKVVTHNRRFFLPGTRRVYATLCVSCIQKPTLRVSFLFRVLFCRRVLSLALGLASLLVGEAYAHADIGVALADPTSVGVSVWTNAGHTLVYLSNVCPVTPVKARLCRPGEQGSVVTAYPNFFENKPYAWNIVPLSLYLYGTPQPADHPLYASPDFKVALEMQARSGYLAPVCSPGSCSFGLHRYWRDVIDVTVVRDVFIYTVRSTRAQDLAVVRWLNHDPNVNHYHGMTNNCANFTQSIINSVLPRSIHRDMLNDLGMMGPKAAARSFSKYAVRHPELGFYVMHFAQQPNDVPRSGPARSGTETAIHQKRYLLPAAAIGDHEVAGSFFVAYYLTGRFSLYNEYARFPAGLSAPAVDDETPTIRPVSTNSPVAAENRASEMLGTKEQWADYRERFTALVRTAQAAGLTDGPKAIAKTPRSWSQDATYTVSTDGAWLTLGHGAQARRVGLTTADILAPGSDHELALQLMLYRVQFALHANKQHRPTWPEFQKDWSLLEQLVAPHSPSATQKEVAEAQ